jgi:hypothetical protein
MAGTELARYLAVTSEHERKIVETRMSPMPHRGRSWRILGGVIASGKPSVFFIFLEFATDRLGSCISGFKRG